MTSSYRRARNRVLVAGTVVLLTAVNGPQLASAGERVLTTVEQATPSYKRAHGAWEVAELPEGLRLNAVHAALLPTGKVLLVAGSGNDQRAFDAGEFRTVVWDPADGSTTEVPTPEDLFCGGHAYLPNGNLLIAGGTGDYEVLAQDVTHAAGVLTLENARPDSQPLPLAEGQLFTSDVDGRQYRATQDVVVEPARVVDGEVQPSSVRVWIEAVEPGEASAFTGEGRQLSIDGADVPGLYGLADTVDLSQQEYRGLDSAYEFDPWAEQYLEVGDLTTPRWYPTLVGLEGGDVLAVSGLDEFGLVVEGENELYSAATRTWREAPELERYFPTYPSLFRMPDGRIFYSGSNAGYGPAEQGRTPGLWDLTDNSFQEVPGLRAPEMTETSTSVLLPPAQRQLVMLAGGGSVGEEEGSTARTDVADLSHAHPTYEPGPDLPSPVRYVSSVVLPDDTVLLTGGSGDYRGRSDSDVLEASLYDAASGSLSPAAPPSIGRNYHSEALLLPDGRVLTAGSDPLFGDAENTTGGTFEQRLELYSPPYLFDEGPRPVLQAAPERIRRGSTFAVEASTDVAQARLLRPSAVTHVTDPEQRSIALDVRGTPTGAELTLDEREGLTPSGWYMLVVLDADGTPSAGSWVLVE